VGADDSSVQLEELPANHQSPSHETGSAQSVDREVGASFSGRAPATAWRIAAVILAVSVVAVALWNRHSRRAAAGDGHPPAPIATSNTAPASSANDSSRTVAPSSLVASPPASKNPSPGEVDASASSGGLPNHRARTSVTKPEPALTLGIRASENCWISVSIDGETVSRETLIAPAHTSIRAKREIVVKVGNAAAVTFLLNGKEVPAQGGEAGVKTFVFDATGMRIAPPTSQSDLVR